MRNKKIFLTGAIMLSVFAVLAVFAPFIAPYEPSAIDGTDLLSPPSKAHLFGTDELGRDTFSRIVYGARVSLSIGIIAVGIATLIGVALGSLAGFYGGWVDSFIMRFLDVMLCFPVFFLILSMVAILEEPTIFSIMAVIGLTSWMGTARLIRAEILSLRNREFIQAEIVMGASHFRVIARHLIPNALAPVLVNVVLEIAAAILLESSLSFLGLGVQPPTPSWGNMLIEAKSTLGLAWWLMLFPGSAILLTILGFNFVGEGIRRNN